MYSLSICIIIGLVCHKDAERNVTTTVTEDAITASYEDVSSLRQSTETDRDYENTSAFEMKECSAYNKQMDVNKSDPDYVNVPDFRMNDPDYVNIPDFRMNKCSAYGMTTKTEM